MRLTGERNGSLRRWSIETTGAIDRALAAVIIVLVLLCLHALSLDGALLRLLVGVL